MRSGNGEARSAMPTRRSGVIATESLREADASRLDDGRAIGGSQFEPGRPVQLTPIEMAKS